MGRFKVLQQENTSKKHLQQPAHVHEIRLHSLTVGEVWVQAIHHKHKAAVGEHF